jgi:uncharacterized protein
VKYLSMSENEKKLISILKEYFSDDSTGHDFYHLIRTYNIAKHLQQIEGGNREVILLSALLHDVHRFIEKNNKKYCHPKDSLPIVETILKKIDVDVETIKNILHCIEFHEEYNFSESGKTVSDIETLILQDADNLDASGAIGIARGFMYAGANNIPMWLPDIDYKRDHYSDDENDPSEIHHFQSKILRLRDNMNTKTGREMAEKRHKFIELYLEEFFGEFKGGL